MQHRDSGASMSVRARRLGVVTVLAATAAAAGPVASAASAGVAPPSGRSTWATAGTMQVRGAPAAPLRVTLAQPDGAKISAVLRGDGARHWYETASGYGLVRGADRTWRYATGVDARGQLTASGVRGAAASTRGAAIGTDVPSGLTRGLRPTADQTPALTKPVGIAPAIGTQPTVVILAGFTNQALTTTDAAWSAKFFGATNSVRDFYLKASYNKLSLTPATESSGTANDGVVRVSIPQTHPNFRNDYGATRGSYWLARQAMTAANGTVNYAAFDTNADGYVDPFELHITVIAAGFETAYDGGPCGNSIWGHQWGLGSDAVTLDGKTVGADGYTEFGERHCSGGADNHMATIGIMAHEMGHDLGWPDLYDTDFSSEGVGVWSLMASGSWGYTTGDQGESPSYPDAWARYTQGWTAPTETPTVGARSLTSAATSPVVFRALANPGGADWNWGNTPATGEYFLFENRTKTGYDASLPGCGILVYHVNEAQSDNSVDNNRLVDVAEADGLGQLDTGANRGDSGDPWPGSANRLTLNNRTNPNSLLNNGRMSGVQMQVTSSGCANPATAGIGVNSAGTFQPVTPSRLLDTRSTAPVGPDATVDVQATGVAGTGIPGVSAVDAVVVNVTAVGPTSGGYATVFPQGTTEPTASNLNFRGGLSAVANLAVVKVGATGALTIANHAPGTTHYLVDVVGYYKKAGQGAGVRFTPQPPTRILDTRSSTPLGANAERLLTVRGGSSGVPTNASGVVMNVTAVTPTSQSYLTVYPNGQARPTASNINWPGAVPAIPNLVYSPIGTNGQVRIYNQRGTVHLLADVVGWFGPTGQFVYHPVQPTRIVDTRGPVGVPTAAPLGAGQTVGVDLTGGTTGIPEGASGVVVNTTVTATTGSSYLTVWPSGVARPNASNLNWTAGRTVPNLVSTKVGTGGLTNVFNAAGQAHVIMDLNGWYGW